VSPSWPASSFAADATALRVCIRRVSATTSPWDPLPSTSTSAGFIAFVDGAFDPASASAASPHGRADWAAFAPA